MVNMEIINKLISDLLTTQEINILYITGSGKGELEFFTKSVGYYICQLYYTVLRFGIDDLFSRLINKMEDYLVG